MGSGRWQSLNLWKMTIKWRNPGVVHHTTGRFVQGNGRKSRIMAAENQGQTFAKIKGMFF